MGTGAGEKKPQPVRVEFPGRSTGMGAYTQYHIFSLRQRREIKPHRTEYSRSGRHWRDIWFLLPGKYFLAWRDVSNSGKHYCGYGALIVEPDGRYYKEKWEGDPPSWVDLSKVCWCLVPEPEY